MQLMSHVKESFSNLFSAKLRSFLAILGVLVGTGSVVALISSSQLATSHALAQFKKLGTNLLAMNVQNAPGARRSKEAPQLRLKQIPSLSDSSNQVQLVAPYISLYKQLSFRGHQLEGEVLGATGALAEIVKIQVARGRFVSILDGHQFYGVIGETLAKKIRSYGVDPLYQQIKIGNNYFTIIGMVKKWQPNFFIYANINNGIIIPLQAAYFISQYAQINNVLFRLIKKPNIKSAQNHLTDWMRVNLPNKKATFRNPEQIIGIVAKQRVTFTWLLGAIGGISLVVGGIGVMNIMLVSVVERRREIGIRMAIGAKRSDILNMFLFESVILTSFGGLLGIFFGVLASFILAIVTGWAFQLYILPPLLGFVVSALVGIVSGFYPAYSASRLDPIQTLQAE